MTQQRQPPCLLVSKDDFERGVRAIQAEIKSNAVHLLKWLHLIDWDQAFNSWLLFVDLRTCTTHDKAILLKLCVAHLVNKSIGFQYKTSEFMLHLFLISLTRHDTNRGRKSEHKTAQMPKRTIETFFLSAFEEDLRLIGVLSNLRKYFQIDVSDTQVGALTTVYHCRLGDVADWTNKQAVKEFAKSIRPPTSKSSSKGRKSPKIQPIKTETIFSSVGKPIRKRIKREPYSSDGDYEQSSDESFQEPPAPQYDTKEGDYMLVEEQHEPPALNNNEPASANPIDVKNFLASPPRTFSFKEVAQGVNTIMDTMVVNYSPEQLQHFWEYFAYFFVPSTYDPVDAGQSVQYQRIEHHIFQLRRIDFCK